MGTENLPWTTAPEIVRGLIPDLDLSRETWLEARRLAREYDGEFGLAPSSIAVGAIYWAALINGDGWLTQRELGEVSGKARPTITRAYHTIAEAEGYDVAPRGRTPGAKDTPRRSLALPTWPIAAVKSLAIPVLVIGVSSVWVFNRVPAAAFERASSDIKVTPVFDGPMFTAVAVLAFVAVLLTFIRPLVGASR